MKTELLLSILSALLSPLAGETGTYYKYTGKDNWVNVSVDTPLLNYQTQNRLYVGTTGMIDNVEKVILRVDRTTTRLLSSNQHIIDYHVGVNCAKKESITTHVVYRNSIDEIISNVQIEKTQPEKFDDSHLFGAICAARALNDVLVNREVKSFDTCDFRQQRNSNTPVRLDGLQFNFPIRWKLDTCKTVKNAVWLYGSGQDEAAQLRLAWVPPLAIRVNGLNCTVRCNEYYQSRLFIN